MSRSARGESLAPSMFPFLAVLLCTMGALVLILMLIVAGAQAATSEAKQEHVEKRELMESQLEVLDRSAQNRLYEGRIALEKERLRLQHFEEHIAEIEDELEQVNQTLQALNSTDEEETEQEQLAQLTELEKQIAEAAEELKNKELEKPDEGDKPIFAIIPYDGPNGTHRRPIYLECDADGVLIQPEGVRLSTDDLRPPYGPGNPLDAALRTIRSEYKPANGAVTSTAYPLLIVRPEGIESYVRARAAMAGWDDQFGYELVRSDLELAFPEPKPGLDQKLARTIASARDRQAALLVAMPGKYGMPRGSGGSLAGGSTSQYDRGSLAGGNFSGRDSGSEFGGGMSGGSDGSNRGSGESSRGGYSATQSMGQPAGSAVGPGSGRAGFAQSGGNGYGSGLSGAQLDALEQSIASNSSNGFAFDPSDASHPVNQALGYDGSMTAGAEQTGQYQSGSQFDGGTGNSSIGGSNSGSNAPAGSSGQSAMGSPQMSGGNQISIPDFGMSASSSGGGSSGQQAGGQAGQQSGQQGAGGSAGQRSSASGGGSSRSSSRQSASSSAAAQPVARSQGENWVTGGRQRQQTPVRRTIRLICTEDAWIVVPYSRIEKEVVIKMEGTPQQRAERLAEVIRARIKSWGLALQGGYWRPELVVEVRPGAMWRYEQLERLFLASGIDIRADESAEQPAATNRR